MPKFSHFVVWDHHQQAGVTILPLLYFISQDWTVNNLLLMLYEAGHLLPPSTGSACMEIKNDWKQVIVISGAAEAIDSRQQLVAPCIVPSKVRFVFML